MLGSRINDYFLLFILISLAPRQIRCESCYIRSFNTQTGAAPFESLMVADVGDVPVNVFNIAANVDIIHQHVAKGIATGCKPLILGGDHSLSYPVLRAIKVISCSHPH